MIFLTLLKFVAFLFFFVLSQNSNAQTLSFSGGVNRHDYFGHLSEKRDREFTGKFGYSFQCTIDDMNLLGDTVPMRASVIFQHYQSDVSSSENAGHYAGGKLNGSVKLDVVGLEFYPFNIRRTAPFYMSFGVSFNWLIHQQLTGTREYWQNGITPSSYTKTNLSDMDDFIRPFTFGLLMRTGYRIPLTSGLSIEPEYKVYLGCSQELQQIWVGNSSVRQSLLCGLVWALD